MTRLGDDQGFLLVLLTAQRSAPSRRRKHEGSGDGTSGLRRTGMREGLFYCSSLMPSGIMAAWNKVTPAPSAYEHVIGTINMT